MQAVTCIEDLRQLAHRKVPRAFIDYAEAGSYAEQTLRANRADLERITFRQRILCDVCNRSTKTTILGEPVELPLALAPIGLCGMQHGDGEILACRAAQQAGIPFTLSTMSICSIEDVAGAVAKPFWFQLYMMKDRGYIRALIERAAAAKCSALVLTVDLQVMGQRRRDIKNGMTVPPQIRIRHRHQAGMGAERRARQAQDFRQYCRSLSGHEQRYRLIEVDCRTVRSDVELERRRMDQKPLAGEAHPQRYSRRRRRPRRGKDRSGGLGCV